jgi:hypothetical protein
MAHYQAWGKWGRATSNPGKALCSRTCQTPIYPLCPYIHYKGLHYEVLGVVRHSETLEPLVLYRAEYGERGLWVRPFAMFTEAVVIDGVKQPRFKPLSA